MPPLGPAANKGSPMPQRDWRNPQWLDDLSASGDWWNDVEAPRGRSGRAQSMDVKSASFLRYEKERELNELIAKGLRNLNELRQPDVPLSQQRGPAEPLAPVPLQPRGREPSPTFSGAQHRSRSARSGGSPVLTLGSPRPSIPTSARAPAAAHPPPPRRSSSASRPAVRSRSASPSFAYFHGRQAHPQRAANTSRLSTPRTPTTRSGALPPRPPLAKRQEVRTPNYVQQITREELEDFYARQEELQARRLNRSPSPEPEHVPRIRVQPEFRQLESREIWTHLYRKGQKDRRDREALLKQAEDRRREAEEEELAAHPFRPQISSAAQAHTPSAPVFQRLFKGDVKHRQANMVALEQELDTKQERLCPFRPAVHDSQMNRRDETYDEFIERLHREAEDLKERLAEQRERMKVTERNRIEMEHRAADHHYKRKAVRREEREKERRLLLAERGGSAIPQELQHRPRPAASHDSSPSHQPPPADHHSALRDRRRDSSGMDSTASSRRHPVFVEPVAAETWNPVRPDGSGLDRAAPRTRHEEVRDDVSDLSRSSAASSSTPRVGRRPAPAAP
eukprot:EG_transcript_7850